MTEKAAKKNWSKLFQGSAFKMSDKSQEEEELSHSEVLADVKKQIEAVCN